MTADPRRVDIKSGGNEPDPTLCPVGSTQGGTGGRSAYSGSAFTMRDWQRVQLYERDGRREMAIVRERVRGGYPERYGDR